jgi:hypothetical protein
MREVGFEPFLLNPDSAKWRSTHLLDSKPFGTTASSSELVLYR